MARPGERRDHVDGPLLVVALHDGGRFAYTVSPRRGWEHWRVGDLDRFPVTTARG